MSADFLQRYPPGPWSDEVDLELAQWSGLRTLILRGPVGALCGYVEVPASSPLAGLSGDAEALASVRVHGGLTWSGEYPGMEKGLRGGWWFGFDCSHAGDLVPALLRFNSALPGRLPEAPRGVYRDIHFVRSECGRLAIQLREIIEKEGTR